MKLLLRNRIVYFFLVALLGVTHECFAISDLDSSQSKEITIAFIFPFNTSKVYITDLTQSKYFFPEETQIAAEFLQGALLAADSLKQQGLDARILVFDSGNDSSAIKTILLKPDLQNADIIFAPFDNDELKAVANFGAIHQIPVVSPLSVSNVPLDSNRYFILANASIKMHCEHLYDYMLTRALTHRTIMVYRKNRDDQEIVNYFKEYVAREKKEGALTLKFIEITDSSKTSYWKLRDSLYKTDVNQILIPSVDEPFVRTMLKELYNLRDDYKFQVYGMPTWSSFDLIPAEHFDSLNVVITSSFWIDKTTSAVNNFLAKYLNKYGVNPSEYSVRGYDEAFYFISQLMQHENFVSTLPSEKPVSMLATSYDFSGSETDSTEHFLENHSICLLQRTEGRWIPVSK